MSAVEGPRALFWGYDLAAPSFRHRLLDVASRLRVAGWRCTVETFPRGRYLRRLWERRRELAASDVVVLSKINLAVGEPALLHRLARRVVLDFDDAIYLGRPLLGRRPDRSRLRLFKFHRTCALCDVVVAGNDFLAREASRTASRVEIVPTTVDTALFPASPPRRDGMTLVWIGRPENLQYLELVRSALVDLSRRRTGLRLRVVSSRFPDWPEVAIERVPWSEAAEVEALVSADVGLSPLSDDDWSRGKCAFKALQYMAAGLPVVASPVGANRDVVIQGESGFLAADATEWSARLEQLIASPELRRAMGRAGRDRVRRQYDRAPAVARVAGLLEALVGGAQSAHAAE